MVLAAQRRPVTMLSTLLLAALTPSDVPTVLLREGDPSPTGVAGQTVVAIVGTATNAAGGRACRALTAGPSGTVDIVQGTRGGAPLGLLWAEGTHAGYEQSALDARFALTGALTVYSADARELASGFSGLDGLWRDGDPSALERSPANFPGSAGHWARVDDVSAALDGRVWFRGGLAAAPVGAVAQQGLFVLEPGSATPVPVLLGGAPVPGFTEPVFATGILASARGASVGARWIAQAALDAPTGARLVLVLDGAGLALGGTLVRENLFVPAGVGGIGDRWDDFTWLGVNSAGQWFFAGDTQGVSTTMDDVLCRETGVYRREGEPAAGGTLVGGVLSAAMNERGELAYVWHVTDAVRGSVPVLFRDGVELLRGGDTVDWDGDGWLDAGAVLVELREGTLSIGPMGELFVAALIDVAGTMRDGFLAIPRALGAQSCAALGNASGGVATIGALGSTTVAANDLRLRCSGMPRFAFGFFLVSRTLGFAAHPGGSAGNLCLGGAIGRYQQQVQSSGAAGLIELTVDLTALPQPTGPIAAIAGETWHFSTWFRDVTAMGGATSNFSDVVSVAFD